MKSEFETVADKNASAVFAVLGFDAFEQQHDALLGPVGYIALIWLRDSRWPRSRLLQTKLRENP